MKNKVILFAILSFLTINTVFAGNMEANSYAWGENIGWVNFNPTNGNVTVNDDKITGHAWSTNYGWINLCPTNGCIFNNNGNLSGYAWGENLGWINFDNVSIDLNTGKFTGYAIILLDNSKIGFDCSNCRVKTSWRPSSPIQGASIIVNESFSTTTNIDTTTLSNLILNNLINQTKPQKTILTEKPEAAIPTQPSQATFQPTTITITTTTSTISTTQIQTDLQKQKLYIFRTSIEQFLNFLRNTTIGNILIISTILLGLILIARLLRKR